MGSGIVCGNLYYVRHSSVQVFIASIFLPQYIHFGGYDRGTCITATCSIAWLSFRVYLDTGVVTSTTLPDDVLVQLLEKCNTASIYIDHDSGRLLYILREQ